MKILILTNYANGLYLFRRELLEAFLADGHEVVVSLPPDENVAKLREIHVGEKRVAIAETPFDRRGMNPVKDLGLFLKYRRLLKTHRPQVVLAYTIKPNIYGGLACRMSHVPCINNVTGLGTAIEHGGLLGKVLLILYRIAMNRSRRVFFQNRGNMEFMQACGVGKNNGDLLPGSGVNLTEHPFCAYPSEQEGILFLAVLRIMRDKGIGEYFAAAECLAKDHPELHFELVGEFEEEERSQYEPEIERLQTAGVLHYAGHVDNVRDYMAACHAVVHPSYHEGLSNVLLEAGACGRPVLASNVSGCTAAFVEGESGISFAPGDAQALIDALEYFLSLSGEQRAQMGAAGRRFIETHFDRQIVIDRYRRELSEL